MIRFFLHQLQKIAFWVTTEQKTYQFRITLYQIMTKNAN